MLRTTAIVLMATFNGAMYVREQILSIQAQTCRDWVLLISDDGSSDDTLAILETFAKSDPRVILLPKRSGEMGHAANFEYLLQESRGYSGQYLFLSDQDDIWEPEKLDEYLRLIGDASAVFSDVEMFSVGSYGSRSFMESMKLSPPDSLYQLIAQNSVVGCSMAVHSSLLELALPFPPGILNHDWWLAVCAMCSQGLEYSEQPLTRYRQHSENLIGGNSRVRNLSRIPDLLDRQKKNIECKYTALAELSERKVTRGEPVPEPIEMFLELFGGTGRMRTVWNLYTGPFRPQSKSLMALQSAAVLFR